MKAKTYLVQIRVKSRSGKRPIVRTIGGDTVFCALDEGMTATWTLRRQTPKPKVKP